MEVWYSKTLPLFRFPLAVGKEWSQTTYINGPAGWSNQFPFKAKVTAYEKVEIDGKMFDTYKVEQDWGSRKVTCWYAPEVGWNVRCETPDKNDYFNYTFVVEGVPATAQTEK